MQVIFGNRGKVFSTGYIITPKPSPVFLKIRKDRLLSWISSKRNMFLKKKQDLPVNSIFSIII